MRKSIQVVAFAVPALAMAALTLRNMTPEVACGLFVTALGAQAFGQAGFVANMSDIAPAHAGKLFGLCNTFGSLAGIMGTMLTGMLLQATGSFDVLFRLTAGLYIVGALCFNAWARGEPVFGEPVSA